MSVFRAVGFDLDGTLFDHRCSAEAGSDRFLQSLGVQPSRPAREAWFAAEEVQFERWRSGQISFQEQRRERLRTVLPSLGVTLPTEESALDAMFAAYLREYRAAWRSFPGTRELLDELRSSGYRLGLLTNGTEQQQLDKLRRTGLADAFDVVCTSERLGAQKPDVRAFVTLAEELQVEPSACLFVGDNAAHDIAGAEAVGMRGLLVDPYLEHSNGIAEALRAALHDGNPVIR